MFAHKIKTKRDRKTEREKDNLGEKSLGTIKENELKREK